MKSPMKLVMTFIIVLVGSANAAQAGWNERNEAGFVLSCKGSDGKATLISPQRKAWLHAGHVIVNHAATLEGEMAFHTNRLAHFSQSASHVVFYGIADMIRKTEFKAGIRLQGDSLGIPAQVDGCATIPIWAHLSLPLPGSFALYIADLDTWNQIPAIDRAILLMQKEVNEDPLSGGFLSEKLNSMSLKAFADVFKDSPSPDFAYKGLSFRKCSSWYNENHPRTCVVEGYPKFAVGSAQGMTVMDSPVDFYPSGALASILVQRMEFNENGVTRQCLEGPVHFTAEGKVAFCTGQQRDSSGELRLDAGAGITKTFGHDKDLQTWTLSGIVYNKNGDAQYAMKVNFEGGGEARQFLPSGFFTPAKFAGAIGLHADGSFRSGILSQYSHDLGEFETFYVEANSLGMVTKKSKLAIDAEAGFYTDQFNGILHLENSTAAAKTYPIFEYLDGIETRTLFFRLETPYASSDQCTVGADTAKEILTVPAGCTVIVHVMTVVEKKRSQR